MHTCRQRTTHSETMDARDYWKHYIEQHGGAPAVAKRLNVPYSTIAGICNGSRGIGHTLAERMAAADPMLDAKRLIWVRPVKAPASQPKPDRAEEVADAA